MQTVIYESKKIERMNMKTKEKDEKVMRKCTENNEKKLQDIAVRYLREKKNYASRFSASDFKRNR